jgi:hypothetical protein
MFYERITKRGVSLLGNNKKTACGADYGLLFAYLFVVVTMSTRLDTMLRGPPYLYGPFLPYLITAFLADNITPYSDWLR